MSARAETSAGSPPRERRDPGAPGSPWRPVAVVSALALGSIGAAAAPRLGVPAPLGAVAGGLAAILAVVALPSLPTRRVAVVMLGLAGLGALRHAALPTTDSTLIVLWAGATLVALVLVDRAQAEGIPQLTQGNPLAPRVPEALRVAALVAAIVVAIAVAVVPTVTDHVGRRMWPGTLPSLGDGLSAPGSLRATPRLDMTSRPRLSDRVVFTVDAPRADFWRGEVFDTWDGQSSWTRSDDGPPARLQRSGNTYELQPDPYDEGALHGAAMRQTFHIETGFSEVLFAAPSAVTVESDRIILGHADGTAAVLGEFGKDAVYTVTSKSSLPTADDLRAAEHLEVPREILRQYAAVPQTSPRVRALAEQITAGAPTTYDKVRAIEQWLSAHTRYSLQAPLSPRGADVVDYFLFTSRLGWCEQVSSSMAVLARSVGIPARLATGFVPGEKDGLSGHFVVRERDAHAWTEIYFPGVGWQGFDPTASVPLAGDAPRAGSWMDEARDHLVQFAIGLGVLVWLAISAPNLLARLRRRWNRRASWASSALGRLERLGRRAGRARAPAETPREYAHALAHLLGDPRLETVGIVIDRDEYAAGGADPAARAAADDVLGELLAARHRRTARVTGST